MAAARKLQELLVQHDALERQIQALRQAMLLELARAYPNVGHALDGLFGSSADRKGSWMFRTRQGNSQQRPVDVCLEGDMGAVLERLEQIAHGLYP